MHALANPTQPVTPAAPTAVGCLQISEVAALLHLSRATIENAIRDGALKVVKFGTRTRITHEALMRFQNEGYAGRTAAKKAAQKAVKKAAKKSPSKKAGR